MSKKLSCGFRHFSPVNHPVEYRPVRLVWWRRCLQTSTPTSFSLCQRFWRRHHHHHHSCLPVRLFIPLGKCLIEYNPVCSVKTNNSIKFLRLITWTVYRLIDWLCVQSVLWITTSVFCGHHLVIIFSLNRVTQCGLTRVVKLWFPESSPITLPPPS